MSAYGEGAVAVLIVTAGDDGLVHRRDAVTDDIIGPPLRGHRNVVKAVTAATTADGDPMIISVSEAGDARRWHAVTGGPIGEPLKAVGCHNGDLDMLRLDDGRQMLICVTINGTVYQRDPVTGQPTGPTIALDGTYAQLVSAYATDKQVPTAVLAVLDGNYDVIRVERWRLDTAQKVDNLPNTTRTIFHHTGQTRMVLANDNDTLTVTALPKFD